VLADATWLSKVICNLVENAAKYSPPSSPIIVTAAANGDKVTIAVADRGAGIARTRRMARQLVSHGHFTVNGVKVNVPSYRVAQYDIVEVRDKSLNTVPFQIARETAGERPIPGWLQVVGERQRILVHQLPDRAQIDVPLTEQLIVEYYSK